MTLGGIDKEYFRQKREAKDPSGYTGSIVDKAKKMPASGEATSPVKVKSEPLDKPTGLTKSPIKSNKASPKKPERPIKPVNVKISVNVAPKSSVPPGGAPAKKPVAPVTGRTRITPPSPEKKKPLTAPVTKKPEAKVAPLQKTTTPKDTEDPSKPKRKRITAPRAGSSP